MRRADRAEQEDQQQGRDALAKALAGSGDDQALISAMGAPWLSKGRESLLANEYQRQHTPKWQTFNSGGDQYRWNKNDPNSRPQMFFDGPAPQPDPYTLGPGEQRFDGSNELVAGSPPKPATTDDITEYQFYSQQAQAAGQQPMSFNDFLLQTKRAGASQTNVDMKGEALTRSSATRASPSVPMRSTRQVEPEHVEQSRRDGERDR